MALQYDVWCYSIVYRCTVLQYGVWCYSIVYRCTVLQYDVWCMMVYGVQVYYMVLQRSVWYYGMVGLE